MYIGALVRLRFEIFLLASYDTTVLASGDIWPSFLFTLLILTGGVVLPFAYAGKRRTSYLLFN
jgi:hypothetical protein